MRYIVHLDKESRSFKNRDMAVRFCKTNKFWPGVIYILVSKQWPDKVYEETIGEIVFDKFGHMAEIQY